MVKVERLHWFAITAMLGWVAVALHVDLNLRWTDGQWDSSFPLAVPLAAALPPIAFYIAFKSFKINFKRASYWFFMVLNAWSIFMLTALTFDILNM